MDLLTVAALPGFGNGYAARLHADYSTAAKPDSYPFAYSRHLTPYPVCRSLAEALAALESGVFARPGRAMDYRAMTVYEPYIAEARRRHGRVTPFRLGFLIGLAGDNLPSPYFPSSSGDALYRQGVRIGRGWQAELAELAADVSRETEASLCPCGY